MIIKAFFRIFYALLETGLDMSKSFLFIYLLFLNYVQVLI